MPRHNSSCRFVFAADKQCVRNRLCT